MRVILYPYKMSSKSYKLLRSKFESKGYECVAVFSDGDYKPKPDDFIIGFGAGTTPTWLSKVTGKFINKPDEICNAINKIDSFELMREYNVPLPLYTVSESVAKRWVGLGMPVLARTRLEGRDGDGICKITQPQEFVKAKLYTNFIKAKQEWRTHVVNGKHVAAQLRVKLVDTATPDVRTTSNGWGLTYDHEGSPQAVRQAGIAAVEALGLDFGAVDIIWDGERAYVLEVNTAPELSNYTAEVYATHISRMI